MSYTKDLVLKNKHIKDERLLILLNELNICTNLNDDDPSTIMSFENICDHDSGFLCEHRLGWIAEYIENNFK